jgi:glycosyltransferase involved in cell wall biosynthesis
MRVLFLSNLYPPNAIGGYERLCFDVAAGLSVRGHDISVLTSDYGGRASEYPGQRVNRCWKLPVGSRAIYEPYEGTAEDRHKIAERNIQCVEEEIARYRPTVLFVWNLYFLDASVLTAIQRRRLPTVFLLTDNWLINFLNPGFWRRYFDRAVLGAQDAWFVSLRQRLFPYARPTERESTHVDARAIFASRYMETLYRQAGFRFSGSTVIHHGISDSPSDHTMARDRLLVPGTLRLLFAGRVVEIKGVHTLIESLPEIIRRLPGLRPRLTIVGDGADPAYLQRVKKRIEQLQLDQHIEFQAAVAEPELPELFARHDIYVFPSLYEPFSLTLIHALRAGIPTIASDAGGNVEIVINGRTGKVFRRGDARALARQVIELARDGPARAALAAAARETAAEFTFSRMLDGVERYLQACQ